MLITRPEEPYRLWCVIGCDLETSRMRRLKNPQVGCKKPVEEEKELNFVITISTHLNICNLYLN